MSKRFPNHHLSLVRLGAVVAVAVAVVFGIIRSWGWYEQSLGDVPTPWFASYVDVTATPTFPFEQPRSDADKNIVLSFIVADPNNSCEPSWGAAYSLDQAQADLDLDRRLARLQQLGGELTASFGGLINEELATVCTDQDQLVAAYEKVLDRYNIRALDFDIEGTALKDKESIDRRATAVATLQQRRAQAGEPISVWLTLPVTPKGLTPDGTDTVAAMLDAGVELSGLNVMTMDFGASKPANQSMSDASISALEATHRQLGVLYKQVDLPLGAATLWSKLGVTPMIGQNDELAEVFGLDDARLVNSFVQEKGVGRVSMWSANRDVTCGPNYYDVTRVSDSCSGIDQGDLSFVTILSQGIDGSPLAAAGITTTAEPVPAPQEDDPAKSPYQIWNELTSYREGTRVVWHQNVYEAKWWTKGDLPDNPVLQEFETAWHLIGPVLPGEKPLVVPTVAPGTYPEWGGEETYVRGDRVLFDGLPYEAKWWTSGQSPQEAEIAPDSSPWLALDPQEVIDSTTDNSASDNSTAD